MTAAVETINAKTAQNILAANTRNRPLSPRVVATYAEDMASGRWKLNGEPIIIASDGTLLDGQHRLNAVLSLDGAVQMLVVRGADATAFDTIDANYTRTAAHILAIRGGTYVNVVASAARLAMNYRAGFSLAYGATRKQVTDFAAANPYLQELAALLHPTTNVLPLSPVVAVAFLSNGNRLFDNDWAAFSDAIASGENLPARHPALTLREWAWKESRRSRRKMLGGAVFCAAARAWNAYMRGETPSHLKVTSNPSIENCEIVGFAKPRDPKLRRAA